MTLNTIFLRNSYFVIVILAPSDMSISRLTSSSFTVTVSSTDKMPPVQRFEVTARAGESSQACDIKAGSGPFTCSLNGFSSNTEYAVSAVACSAGPGSCGSAVIKNVITPPLRTSTFLPCCGFI